MKITTEILLSCLVLLRVHFAKPENLTETHSTPWAVTVTDQLNLTTALQDDSYLPASSSIEETTLNSVFEVRYRYKNDSIPQVLSDLLTKNKNIFGITTQAVTRVLDLENISLSNFRKLLEIIPVQNAQINCYEIVSSVGIKLGELLRDFNNYIPDSKKTIPQILHVFDINANDYISDVAFGNDSSLCSLLETGNYTDTALATALHLANMTEESVFRIVWPKTISAVNEKPYEDFIDLAEYFNLVNHIPSIFEALNVTSATIWNSPTFNTILTKLQQLINSNDVWATATSADTLVSVREFPWRCNNHTEGYVVNVNDSKIEYKIKSLVPKDSYVVISVDAVLDSYLPQEYAYANQSYKNCQCLRTTNSGLLLENLTELTFEGDFLQAQNYEEILYDFGSPLICENRLYGLSNAIDDATLSFLTFKQIPEITTNGVGTKPEENPYEASLISSHSPRLNFSYVTFVFVFLFVKC